MHVIERRTHSELYKDDPTSPTIVLKAWREWIGQSTWSHFITVTFETPRRVRSDGGDLDRVAKQIRRHYPVGGLFLAGESHAFGDLHVHGILGHRGESDELQRARATRCWSDLHRRFGRSEVRKVRSSKDVANYCTKYVVKEMASYLVD